MAKVKITGHASGTGILTVTAPNTSTDRTITLPDATGTLLTEVADDAITLAKMASGTDGNVISYDASGNPVAVATGSAGQVLTSAGAGAPPTFAAGGDFVTISSAKSEVDVANLDVTLPTGYTSFVLCGRFFPATDGQQLHLRFSIDSASSYESGSNYNYGKFDIGASSTIAAEHGASQTQIVLNNGDGNAITEGSFFNIEIEPSIADGNYNSYNSVAWKGYRLDGSTNYRALLGTGVFQSDATTRATHLRLFYASGNVSEYHYTLFGRKS
jgi:hypothetical protein